MKYDSKQLNEMSNSLRALALDGLIASNSGHLGIVFGASDIVSSLYANHFNKSYDKFVLSAGHGSALLYSVLKLSGYEITDMESFRKIGGLPGHPEFGIDGVSTTTGPLGQGVGNSVGMALAQKIAISRGVLKNNGFVYCLCSDGDLMEGITSEAIAFAGKYNLNNLILLWDDNKTSIDGVALNDIDIPVRVAASGFKIISVDGHDFKEINNAFNIAKKSDKPVFIQCKTIIGKGSSVAGKCAAHGLSVSLKELTDLKQKFQSDIGQKLWEKVSEEFAIKTESRIYQDVGISFPYEYKNTEEFVSTRKLSGQYLEQIVKQNPSFIGGSADLSESTNTKTESHKDITANDFSGNFINYGVREHAMAAIMNGLSLSGFRPYGGTFLVFSDYMRPAIRLSALMKLPVIYVFSHDSVCVGEDGPTHQPIEQLGSLRLIPNLNVFRPCNMAETAFSWQMALRESLSPVAIILSRQKFMQIKTENVADLERGGYIIYKSKTKKIKLTIIATGSEVPLAVEVAKKLKDVNVISMPCVEIFRMQPIEYKNSILQGRVIALEAGVSSPWYEFADAVIGIDEFGRSGAGADVYKGLGFDIEKITDEIINKMK